MKSLRSISSASGEFSHYEILLKHPNGELRWLPIEAWAERWICVRWGVAGQYDIMLKTGYMISRSKATRMRQMHNPWIVFDLSEAREWLAERLGISKEENEARYEAHNQNMPFRSNGSIRRTK